MPWLTLSFHNQYLFTILHGVYSAKKPRRPGSDNNQIVVFGSRQKLLLLAGFKYILRVSPDFFMKFCQRNHSTSIIAKLIGKGFRSRLYSSVSSMEISDLRCNMLK